ncbi:hypothetical protein KFK09_026649 [Dendrobium nobile]|uniref:Uncharacterized protein n=1 Tax=Dendrobium nobile TaxID=94219 RepID=A0A8T3A8B8_DENNO|nr:hypothetical protein KFK09_026649 [Dendrobium nobile]
MHYYLEVHDGSKESKEEKSKEERSKESKEESSNITILNSYRTINRDMIEDLNMLTALHLEIFY